MAHSVWLDQLVTNLKDSNAPLEALAFVENNYVPLSSLGLEAFNEVLSLFKTGQTDTALLVLSANLWPEDMIAAENANAQELSSAVAKYEKFKSELESVALSLIPIVATVAKAAATGGIGGLI